MRRSIELDAKTYPSFGKCIFCGTPDDLTDEHIVPLALTGTGQILISNGSCRACNNYANETYEQPALAADFLPVRHMLQLKRRRRGKKKTPRKMPLVSYEPGAVEGVGDDGFVHDLPPENYPPIFSYVVHEPAGLLLGVDKSQGAPRIRKAFANIGTTSIQPASVTLRHKVLMGGPEMVAAKMAFCWAVAERGLDAFHTSDLLALLRGQRSDTFNFVGGPLVPEQLAQHKLHKLYFRKRDEWVTVLVHLFATFGGPIHEVVIGKAKGVTKEDGHCSSADTEARRGFMPPQPSAPFDRASITSAAAASAFLVRFA